MTDKIAISLLNVSKKYQLKNKQGKNFWALKKTNLNIAHGERIGISGPNGAGKTTLLKIIAGITTPSTGSVSVSEKVVSLINLDAGFHPDLTGRENLYINGLLANISKQTIKNKQKEIIAFAKIGSFIDQPFYSYSAGMKFRLAFSIAIASNCKILLIDEIFATGDIGFQHKTVEKIKKLQEKSHVTTIICSHIPQHLLALSNKFIHVKDGNIYNVPDSKFIRNSKKQISHWNNIYSNNINKNY